MKRQKRRLALRVEGDSAVLLQILLDVSAVIQDSYNGMCLYYNTAGGGRGKDR